MSRRPSVSIYDYPEHLNPFKDDTTNPPTSHPRLQRENSKSSAKEMKHKFWTFGRSRKKRSNSFSIKSTWNGLFGKRKESDQAEKRSTIITVSSTYKREPFDRPVAPPRISKDQQEFDEALGTLVRRRKYTMDSGGSRYSSSLTVNGDPARIYDGSPQDTTTSIMGDLTPKAPARRFGQVSPRPTDKIPPLNFEDKESKENDAVTLRELSERTPVPPTRRSATRSSQRLNASNLDTEEETSRLGDVTLRDENENVPEDYIFKRFGQDSVRRSNISINSCVSISSTASGYGRKKRRAPQPPRRAEQLETPEENEIKQTPETANVESEITESIDISRVTENIDEMTKRSQEMIETSDENKENSIQLTSKDETNTQNVTVKSEEIVEEPITLENIKSDEKNVESEKNQGSLAEEKEKEEGEIKEPSDKETSQEQSEQDQTNKENDVVIEYCRKEEDKMEIIKDINEINSKAELEVCLRRKNSADRLSREESFSVQEEIKKIEKQIQALESKNSSKDSTDDMAEDVIADRTSNTRLSLQANRRHFFQNMVDTEENKDAVKIEFKELPREQKDIHVIKLTDSPVPVEAPKDPVKVIELHISEPIRQRPEILDDVNPIPKPRRHASLSHNGFEVPVTSRERSRNSESFDKRGKSV